MSKVSEEDSIVENAVLLWVLQTATENIENMVSAVKNMSCKCLISLFVIQIHYVKDPSVKALVKCIH